MKLATAIELFLKELESLNYSDRTIKGYGQELHLLENMPEMKSSNVEAITSQMLADFLNPVTHSRPLSASYRNRRLSCLRSFFNFLQRKLLTGQTQNPTLAFSFARVVSRKPSPLSYAEYLSILEAVRRERSMFLRKRNWAIIVMFYNSGLRLSELASLNIGQIDFNEARLIEVKRKGNRIVDLPINMNVIVALNNWLKARKEKAEHTSNTNNNSVNNFEYTAREQALFITAKNIRISTRMVEWLVKSYAENAGIERSITPHTFRHSHCTEIQKRGAGMYVAKELMDHSNIKTTSRYSHANEQAMRQAVDSLIDQKQWLDE